MQRVLAELQTDGITDDEIFQKGLQITTTLVPKAQTAAYRPSRPSSPT